MKATNSSVMCETIYHNGSYIMLFGKRIFQSFEIHMNNSSFLK